MNIIIIIVHTFVAASTNFALTVSHSTGVVLGTLATGKSNKSAEDGQDAAAVDQLKVDFIVAHTIVAASTNFVVAVDHSTEPVLSTLLAG